MSTFTIQRLATPDETAAEMDRRGAVIERLETNVRHWREEVGKLKSREATLVEALRKIASPDDLARDPENFGAFAETFLKYAQDIARAAIARDFPAAPDRLKAESRPPSNTTGDSNG